MYSYFIICLISPIILFKKLPIFDFAFSNSPFLVDTIPVLWLKLFGKCKHWILMMDSIVPHPKKRGGNNLLNHIVYLESIIITRLANLFASLVFTVNLELEKEMRIRGISQNIIVKSQNGLFLGKIRSVSKSKKNKSDAIYMGRISANKGIFDLLEAWKNIVHTYPKAKLIVMGTGMAEPIKEFRLTIKRKKLEDNVTYLGLIQSPQKYEIMKSSKMFIYLAKVNVDESWGISLMEGLACGLPAISYDLKVYKNIYQTPALIQIKSDNINLVTENIENLLANSNKRSYLSMNAAHFTRKFDWNDIAQKDLLEIRKLLHI